MITDHLTLKLHDYMRNLPSDQAYMFQEKHRQPLKASSAWFRQTCKECETDEPRRLLILHFTRSKFITDKIEEDPSLSKVGGNRGTQASHGYDALLADNSKAKSNGSFRADKSAADSQECQSQGVGS